MKSEQPITELMVLANVVQVQGPSTQPLLEVGLLEMTIPGDKASKQQEKSA